MTADKQPAKLRTACYHEAGHALIADLCDVPIISVCAKVSGTGKVEPQNLADADPNAVLRVAHAGVAAERASGCDKSARLRVDTDDGKLAYRAKERIRGNHVKLDGDAEREVQALLKEHEEELRLLADFICRRANTTIPWADIEAELEAMRGQAEAGR